MPIYRRLPKRGFNNIFSPRTSTSCRLAVSSLRSMQASSMARRPSMSQHSRLPASSAAPRTVSAILADGELKAKLTLEVAGASRTAIEKVEKAGGSIKLLASAPKAASE
jgi:large subunit ribosomal protein L15